MNLYDIINQYIILIHVQHYCIEIANENLFWRNPFSVFNFPCSLYVIFNLYLDLGLLFSNQSKQDVMKAVLFLMCILIVTGNIVASSFASS